MKFCGNCGAQNDDDAVMCGSCGSRLEQAEDASVETSPAPVASETVTPVTPAAPRKSVAEKLSVLKKFRWLAVNAVVLFVSIFVMVSGFTGGFKYKFYIDGLEELGEDGEAYYIEVEQSAYKAASAWMAYRKASGMNDILNSSDSMEDVEEKMKEYEELAKEAEELENAMEKAVESAMAKAFGNMDSGDFSESSMKKAQAKFEKELKKELSKVNVMKYDAFRLAMRKDSSSSDTDTVKPFYSLANIIIGTLVMPIALACAITSLIFAIIAATNMARKKTKLVDKAVTVPFVLSIIMLYVMTLGGLSAGGWLITSIVMLTVGAALIAAYTILSGDVKFGWRGTVLLGVTAVVAAATALMNVFSGTAVTDIFNGNVSGSSIASMYMVVAFVPVAFGLALGLYYHALGGLCGGDVYEKLKKSAVSLLVLNAIVLGGNCLMAFMLGDGMGDLSVTSVITTLLSIGLVVFLSIFRLTPESDSAAV